MPAPGLPATVTEAPLAGKHQMRWVVAGLVAGGLAVAAIAALLVLHGPLPATVDHLISQKNRKFSPNTLTVAEGDTVTIVNDDADLHHHAYVSSRTFRFDSGDQSPGSRTPIRFTVPGRFNVLCGIHPKMRLVVTVKQ